MSSIPTSTCSLTSCSEGAVLFAQAVYSDIWSPCKTKVLLKHQEQKHSNLSLLIFQVTLSALPQHWSYNTGNRRAGFMEDVPCLHRSCISPSAALLHLSRHIEQSTEGSTSSPSIVPSRVSRPTLETGLRCGAAASISLKESAMVYLTLWVGRKALEFELIIRFYPISHPYICIYQLRKEDRSCPSAHSWHCFPSSWKLLHTSESLMKPLLSLLHSQSFDTLVLSLELKSMLLIGSIMLPLDSPHSLWLPWATS